MIIFYTVSYYGKSKYQKNYNLVLNAIEAAGIKIISPEKGNYLDVLNSQFKGKIKDKETLHYHAIRKGILMADAVIIEASFEDFQLGAEAGYAVENKKPLLCLSINENFSKKMHYRYFQGAKYNQFNIEEIVNNFIKRVEAEHYSERFNCFISPTQLSYLKRKAKSDNVTASEYIRKLIDDDRNG